MSGAVGGGVSSRHRGSNSIDTQGGQAVCVLPVSAGETGVSEALGTSGLGCCSQPVPVLLLMKQADCLIFMCFDPTCEACAVHKQTSSWGSSVWERDFDKCV